VSAYGDRDPVARRRDDFAPRVTKLLMLCHGVNIALPKCVRVVTPRAVQEATVAHRPDGHVGKIAATAMVRADDGNPLLAVDTSPLAVSPP